MSHVLKNLLIALVVVLLFLGVYVFLIRNTDVGDETTPESAVDIASRTNQIVNDTKKVDSYALDTEIFTDVRFSSLNDFHIEVPDVRTGRTNPFLPVE